MTWSKKKTAAVAGVVILLALGTTIAVFEAKNSAARKKDPVAYEILHQSLWQKVFPQKTDENELRHQLVGIWTIIAKKFRSDSGFRYFPMDNLRLKMWTLTNWSIVTYDTESNVVYSASGPYELHGNNYTETIEAATGGMTNYLGAKPRFKIRVDGDKYYQMSAGKNPGLEEMGQRVQ
jgi:hypothetical protein